MTTIGRWSPNKVRSRIIDASWATESRYAFELRKPSSVTYSGTSASIVGLGSVDFSLATSLSINNVFVPDYDNYMIVSRISTGSTSKLSLKFNLRASGTDDTTASSYTFQYIRADSTSVIADRLTNTYGVVADLETDGRREGFALYVYGPSLAQPTAWRSLVVAGDTGAGIYDYAGTHNQSTAYDGFTLAPVSSSITGNIAVYGLRG